MREATLTPQTDPARAAGVLTWLLGLILILAPLFRSGKPPLAILALELLAVCLLVLVLWHPGKRLLSGWETTALALLLVLPLLYLIPLPPDLADWLPGRQPYLAAQALLNGNGAPPPQALSLYPLETESALLLLLIPAGVFLGARALDAERARQLVLVLLVVGAVQALLGLLQYGASEGSPALFGMSFSGRARAQGTYTNPDHLAGLLEMLLPMALALLFYSVGQHRRGVRRGWRERIVFVSSLRGHTAVVYAVIALLLLLGLVFTRSRAGIALGIVGILLATAMFARRIGGDNVYGATGTIVALALGAGLAIGLVPVLDRFSVDQAIADARWSIYSATLSGIGAFSPLGSGPGTYPDVFPAFQPLELGRWFINNAHNDYLEWLFEGGLLAAGLIALLLALYARQWFRVWTKGAWPRQRFVQAGAGLGLLLLLLHSLVDFNLHIPANIAYAAFLAGLFFADPQAEAVPVKHKRRQTLRMEEASGAEPAVSAGPQAAPAAGVRGQPVAGPRQTWVPPPDQIKNPFLDED